MSRRQLRSWVGVVVVSAAVSVLAMVGAGVRSVTDASAGSVGSAGATSRPLSTGVLDPFTLGAAGGAAAYANLRRTGAQFVRMHVTWEQVAPDGKSRPAGFDPRNPADPRYRWAQTDTEVKLAVRNGFTPLLYVQTAPAWTDNGTRLSGDGPFRPSPSELADFATAAATRYGGSFRGLPRVRYWQVWNEPNLRGYLMPQFENGKPVSPILYRAMVNAMAAAVHAVHRDNVVVAGGLAPYGGDRDDPSRPTAGDSQRVRPLEFMREMLCMSGGAKPKPTCNERVEFDVWSHHPYAYGGPTYEAFHPDDASIGDLGEMRSLLSAAARAGHVKSRGQPSFWVTEFSYDSKPDPMGLPLALHARWVSEALYRMWTDGVSLVTWFLLRDQSFPNDLFQSGLYFRGQSGIQSDRPKPAMRAFRFPFVAFRQQGGAISYWGRTPAEVKKNVVVEQKSGGRWRQVAAPAVDRYGIFLGRVAQAPGSGSLRARLADRTDVSVPFSLKVPEDFRFCPFGTC